MPLTDGAATVWVGSRHGIEKPPARSYRVKLLDWELAAVNFRVDVLLTALGFAIPRLLARHGLRYADIALREIHE